MKNFERYFSTLLELTLLAMLTIIKRLRHVAALELEDMLNKKLTHSDDATRRESKREEKSLVEVNLKLRHPHLSHALVFSMIIFF